MYCKCLNFYLLHYNKHLAESNCLGGVHQTSDPQFTVFFLTATRTLPVLCKCTRSKIHTARLLIILRKADSMPLYCRATSTYLHHVPQIPAPGFLPLVLLIDLQDALLQTSRKSSEDSFRPTLLKLEKFSSPWKPLQQRQPSNEQSHLVGPEAVDMIPLPPVVSLGIQRSSNKKN